MAPIDQTPVTPVTPVVVDAINLWSCDYMTLVVTEVTGV